MTTLSEGRRARGPLLRHHKWSGCPISRVLCKKWGLSSLPISPPNPGRFNHIARCVVQYSTYILVREMFHVEHIAKFADRPLCRRSGTHCPTRSVACLLLNVYTYEC